ncbi:MAG: tetratricopeptide repeat protein [Bacteroidota bacterium]
MSFSVHTVIPFSNLLFYNLFWCIWLLASPVFTLNAQNTDTVALSEMMQQLNYEIYSTENHEQALYILEQSEQLNFNKGILFAKERMGFYYDAIQEIEQGIFTFHDVYQLAKEVKDTSAVIGAYLGLGNCYYSMNEFEISISYYQKSKKLAEQISDVEAEALALNGMSLVYTYQKRDSAALAVLLEAKALLAQLPSDNDRYQSNKTTILSNLASTYAEMDRVDEALIYLKQVLASSKAMKDSLEFAVDHYSLAYAYRQLGALNKALAHYDSSLYFSTYFQQDEYEYSAYAGISTVLAERENYQDALAYYEKYHELERTSIGRETRRQLTELEFRYEAERKEKEFLQAQQKVIKLKLARQNLWLTIGILLIILLFGGFTFMRWHDDAKHQQALQATENALIESELKHQQQEATQLQSELENKQADLTNLALDIARKNEFSSQLVEELKTLQKDAPAPINTKLRAVTLLADDHLRISDDLAQFQSNIQAINQEFYAKLDAKFAGLSTNEKYLCGLIRLNLSNKDIAAIRGISTNSAKVSRYRLRKKLGLESSVDIVQFLQQF